jgi:glutathione S-transferase
VGAHVGWGLASAPSSARPAFERYHARLADRPAARRASAIDDALLPPRA